MTEKLSDERLAELIDVHMRSALLYCAMNHLKPDQLPPERTETVAALRELQSRRTLDAGRREALWLGESLAQAALREYLVMDRMTDRDIADRCQRLEHCAATLRKMAGEG